MKKTEFSHRYPLLLKIRVLLLHFYKKTDVSTCFLLTERNLKTVSVLQQKAKSKNNIRHWLCSERPHCAQHLGLRPPQLWTLSVCTSGLYLNIICASISKRSPKVSEKSRRSDSWHWEHSELLPYKFLVIPSSLEAISAYKSFQRKVSGSRGKL